MNKNAALLVFLVLAGTARATHLGSCTFQEPISVRIATYETSAALMEKYRDVVSSGRQLELARRNAPLEGFATRRGNIHTLHVLEIDWDRRESTVNVLGHELLHAFCGSWHPTTL